MKDIDKKLEEYSEVSRSAYEKNPSKTIIEISDSLSRIKNIDSKKNDIKSILNDIGKEKLALILSIAGIVLVGLLNIGNVDSEILMMYYFGLIFFLAGMFIGLKAPGFGLIFLFSHGGIGAGTMVGGLISQYFKSSLLSENPTNAYIYLGGALIFIVSGFISAVIYNLSKTYRSKMYSMAYPFILIFIGFLMVSLFPYIANYIVNI